jgi:hypothetical protein
MERNQDSGATHWYVEATYGERPFQVTDPKNPRHIQVRTDHHPLWLKENLITKGVSHLPSDWKYMMWKDGDIQFLNQNWAHDVVNALQIHPVVQPHSHAVDLGPNMESNNTFTSFAYAHQNGSKLGDKYGQYMHPGFSWAWRRSAYDAVGGMIDRAILGSGDDHMAKGLIGEADRSMPKGLHPNYIHMVKQWEDRALRNVKKNIGAVPGTLLHYFHGAKVNRQYWNRWDILKENNYDPYADVTKDSQGIIQLSTDKWALRDGILKYFKERKEDQLV